jgi:hypothetical protein
MAIPLTQFRRRTNMVVDDKKENYTKTNIQDCARTYNTLQKTP